jgi:hypothetical protein
VGRDTGLEISFDDPERQYLPTRGRFEPEFDESERLFDWLDSAIFIF